MKKLIIVMVICVITFPNLPIINKSFALALDNDYYRYANADGSFTYRQDFSFKSPVLSTDYIDRFIEETSPGPENREVYRVYKINPLCFWRWSQYFLISRHFRYMDWTEIEQRRSRITGSKSELTVWQDF